MIGTVPIEHVPLVIEMAGKALRGMALPRYDDGRTINFTQAGVKLQGSSWSPASHHVSHRGPLNTLIACFDVTPARYASQATNDRHITGSSPSSPSGDLSKTSGCRATHSSYTSSNHRPAYPRTSRTNGSGCPVRLIVHCETYSRSASRSKGLVECAARADSSPRPV